MTFFNKKEDVIDIELTPYGKYLLSKGQFQPVYYEFYDDDIIYNLEFASETEIQGQIQKRISETPKLKAQHTFESAEKRMKEYKKAFMETGGNTQPVIEKRKNFSFSSLPLANCSLDNDKGTSIAVKLLSGDIKQINLLDSKGFPRNIKQIELETSYYDIEVSKLAPNEQYPEVEGIATEEIEINSQRVLVSKEEDYLLFDLEELGVDYKNENFEIYIYELVESEEETIEKPLNFVKEYKNIENNILYEPGEREIQNIDVTREFVQYYFSVLRDKEIPINLLCKHLTEEEILKLNSIDGYSINCKQFEAQEMRNNPELFISEEALSDLEGCDD